VVEISQWPKIEDVAVLEYREYPYHITHYDPDHPDYIPDRKADYYARISTDQFNYQLDRLKSDLKMQREVSSIPQFRSMKPSLSLIGLTYEASQESQRTSLEA
jgi:hypothetical protein